MRDSVKILVRSGRGGDGCVSFRREKFIPRGGPDGGDGGRGGHVYIRSKDKISTLVNIRNHGKYVAETGSQGTSDRKNGKHGEDTFIDVPLGTVVIDAETEEILGELMSDGDKLLVATGGDGGRGNCHFATPQNRAPRVADPGLDGQERELELQFRVKADVAALGYPSSGKSSFVNFISGSRSKAAEYAFSTTGIHLGVVKAGMFQNFTIVDMPALVPSSHKGKGLGNRFLAHLHRVSLILFVLDASCADGDDPSEQLKALRKEVAAYNKEFSSKEIIVALNKIDVADEDVIKESVKKIRRMAGGKDRVFCVSVKTGDGVDELLNAITALVCGEES